MTIGSFLRSSAKKHLVVKKRPAKTRPKKEPLNLDKIKARQEKQAYSKRLKSIVKRARKNA